MNLLLGGIEGPVCTQSLHAYMPCSSQFLTGCRHRELLHPSTSLRNLVSSRALHDYHRREHTCACVAVVVVS